MKFLIKIITISIFIIFYNNAYSQCNENTHSNNENDNWLSCTESENPNSLRGNGHWILYDLGYTYPITTSHIWNYNVAGETGKGFKNVVFDYSIDGTTWNQWSFYEFGEASGTNLYDGEQGPDFGNINARYILITATSNHDFSNCYGLAEMRFDIDESVEVGLAEIEDDNSVQVFPIPTSDILNITIDNIEVKEMIIRNVTGQELQRYPKYKSAMDVSYLVEGVYFLIINTVDNKIIVSKFVKI